MNLEKQRQAQYNAQLFQNRREIKNLAKELNRAIYKAVRLHNFKVELDVSKGKIEVDVY